MPDLTKVTVESGVNEAGDPFVSVFAHSSEGRIWAGQIEPESCRELGMSYIAAAEAAEQDAAVLRVMRHLGLPDEAAGMIVVELRDMRAEGSG